jgi:hypothetical protein
LKGGRELHAIRFQELCVSVLVQRDAPELPLRNLLGGMKPQIRSGHQSVHEPGNLSMEIKNRLRIFRWYV